MSISTPKPSWRDTIPDDWDGDIISRDCWQDFSFYADLAVEMASEDITKLKELIDQLDNLYQLPAFGKALEYLSSEDVSSKPESQRADLWEQLTIFSQKHRIFADSKWSLPHDIVSKD